MRSCLAALLLLSFLQAGLAQQVAVPALQARVVDRTATLSAQQVATLEERLKALEQAKGAQVAVLVVPTTAPEAIEQFGIRVAEQWKLGRKGVDDGAILILTKDDHRLRIEVGYGLEGALSDAVANRIISERMLPKIKAGDYYGGIEAGVDALVQVISSEPLPAPRPAAGSVLANPHNLFTALVVALVAGGLLRSLLGRLPAALLVGGLLGGGVFLAASSVLLALGTGLVAFALTLVGASGLVLGGGVPGLGGSGGVSGGGFSGGGGGFGGGGASGRW